MPRLSFVVPYYQKLNTISRCLKSLFSQSVKDIEVIVVFDGPDKEGERIAQRFKKVQVHTIPHSGAPAARNAGAKLATGEFISFWDADCYIEPGAAAVWLQIFDKNPDVDFVYAGYRFPEGKGGIEGESFDPWLLQVNNYISGMFPIRREKAPQWDESLKSLQDWDFWLTAVKNGCKGKFIRGFAFETEYPDQDSISGKGCTPTNWLERLETIKKKHGIPLRTGCVCSVQAKDEGIALAKILDMDYRDYATYFPNRYDTVVQLGFPPSMANMAAMNFQNPHGPKLMAKMLFWRGRDVWSLYNETSRAAADALAIALNASATYQFCEDKAARVRLEELGFSAEVLPLPLDFSSEKIAPLPIKPRVLLDFDMAHAPFVNAVRRAMPNLEFIDLAHTPIDADSVNALLRLRVER